MALFKDRTGEININNQGLKMWIKEYRGVDDIDVEFEDGFILYNKKYGSFKNKTIENKNYPKLAKSTLESDRLGEIKYNNQGLKMEIVDYKNTNNITVRFEDGYLKNSFYQLFQEGKIHNPNYKHSKLNNRVGEIKLLNNGYTAKIIKYKNANDMEILIIETNEKIKCTYIQFKKGNIRSVYERNLYNIGYIGEGEYSSTKHSKIYRAWSSMFFRCYNEARLKSCPSYKDCEVCEQWHNFQNFAKWYEDNYYEIEGEKVDLDKDILIKGNRVYSPETCIYVPQKINVAFVNLKNKTDLIEKINKYIKVIPYDTFVKLSKALSQDSR